MVIPPTDPCRRRCLPESVGEGFMTASFAPTQTAATAAEIFWVDPRPSGGGYLAAPHCEHAFSLPEMRPNRYVEHESRQFCHLMPTPGAVFFRRTLRLASLVTCSCLRPPALVSTKLAEVRKITYLLVTRCGHSPGARATSGWIWDLGAGIQR